MAGVSAGLDRDRALERRPRRLLFAVLGLLAVGAIGYAVIGLFTRSVVYYRTPSEVLATAPGTFLRLSGDVVSGSVQLSAEQGTVSFRITDGHNTIPVVYRGPAPDSLKDGAQAVAEGRLGSDGVFRAGKVIAKCPSKFSTKSPGG